MRFRQVHLDFHNSELLQQIGSRFSKTQFQEMLTLGHVDSITLFAKCHHGWSYHPTAAGAMHPGLDFDLLGAMIEAAREIGVRTPVYVSAGLDERLAESHPEWLVRDAAGLSPTRQDYLQPFYRLLCMNSPYLDALIRQIEEVVAAYDADGLFLDIVGEKMCYCHHCIAALRREGQDPRDADAVRELGKRVYAEYTSRVNEAVRRIKPELGVFHNGGHIRRGRRDLIRMNAHLELESLPTGGYGYDHFPLSARYVQNLGMEFLGMTGKFHTHWGEFGGYKHPNALRYETALSLANGARCSVGDQLHPEGLMDEATYRLIGSAYGEVAQKEAWCAGATNVADIAVLSVEAVSDADTGFLGNGSDTGAVRMLLEGKYLFDVVDTEADFGRYKVLILPDAILLGPRLRGKLERYLADGGQVLASGRSGLTEEGDRFAIDLGVRWTGENPYRPAYIRPDFPLSDLGSASCVFYARSQLVELDGGRPLGRLENPYYNRDLFAYCSHQHFPNSPEDAGPAIVESGNGIYVSWPIFEEYATVGSYVSKALVRHALDRLLPRKTLETGLPAQGVVTVQRQEAFDRNVVHLLYASPVKRGQGIEIIEDIVPLYNVAVAVRCGKPPAEVYLAPERTPLPFDCRQEDGDDAFCVAFKVPELNGHQMVVLQF
ncbi:alpha-amylase family protein [Cohnella sp. 56]|uniref:alpha-amylase family protein n=1 Tax=Cohnella sp. 56 TaxID=3113722 RepID=UPI0030E84F3C